MNQIDFAKAIGVSQGTLSDIETDKSKPSVDTLVSVSRYSKASIDWIATGDGETPASDLTANNDRVHISQLNPGTRIRLLRVYANKSKREIAEALNVSEDDVEKWEKNILTNEVIDIVSNYYGASPFWIMHGLENKYATDDRHTNSIGERIKYVRHLCNLSVDQTLNITGLTSAQFGAIETDLAEPPIDFLAKLSDYCNITIDWLIKGTRNHNQDEKPSQDQSQELYKKQFKSIELSDDEEHVVHMYRALSKNDKDDIKVILTHKYSRSEDGLKKKDASLISGHGEEAACEDNRMRA